MTHVRACPECGTIVPWTKSKKKRKMLPNGEVATVYEMKTTCPEHGEFDNIRDLRKRLNGEMNRVLVAVGRR